MSGLRMTAYLSRVHPDDLSMVALEFHAAITSGASYQCEYRVRHADGKFRQVGSFARCFRGSDREPSQFAGIIYPVDLLSQTGGPRPDTSSVRSGLPRK
ncbi:PAS domain-containing protein [Rhizobium sp. NZLR1b]|nr:PAS domain-containing protein [Rhizobium sp. NZLR1b]